MANFFITDKNGTKHSFTEQQLQALAAQGRITPNTPLESDTGHQGVAGQIPGLQFKTAVPPVHQPAPPSAAAPAVEQSAGSSWQITLIGAILIMVVGGIGWAIIEGTATSKQTPSKKSGEAVAEAVTETAAQQTASSQLQFTDAERAEFTDAEQTEIDKFCATRAKPGFNINELLIAEAFEGNVAVVRFLISKGAEVNAKDDDGLTPLFAAMMKRHIEVAQVLASKGADVNAKDKNGFALLFFAVTEADVELAQLLVSNGADVNIRSDSSVTGVTPLDAAKRLNHTAMVQYLTSVGGTDRVAARVQQVLKQFDSQEGARMREKIDFCNNVDLSSIGRPNAKVVELSEQEKDGITKYLLLVENVLEKQYSSSRLRYLLKELENQKGWWRTRSSKIDAYITCEVDARASRDYLLETFDDRVGYIASMSVREMSRDQVTSYNSAVEKDKQEVKIIQSLLPEANRLSGNAHDARENKKIEDAERAKKQEEERKRLFGN